MPKYRYTAVGLGNKKIKAEINARDEADLKRILRTQELVLIKHRELEEHKANHRLNAGEIAEFSRQLSGMLGSGITVLRALEILKNRDFKKHLIAVYTKLHADVSQGSTLSEALKLQPNAFPELFVNMFVSAEMSGQLERVAGRMAAHYDKEFKLSRKLVTAMTYPIVLLVITVIVVMLIFTVVLPTFFELFEDMELPAITQAVIGISSFLQNGWYYVIALFFIAMLAIRLLFKMRAVRLLADRLLLKIPIVGKLMKIIYTARFSRTLASLYSSGVSMISALEITAGILGNKFIENQFPDVVKNVRNGEPLSEAVGAVIGFDTKLAASILIGEESGRLDSMLDSTADGFDYEAEVATERLVTLVQPVMIVLMAIVIGFIMASVVMPLTQIYQTIG